MSGPSDAPRNINPFVLCGFEKSCWLHTSRRFGRRWRLGGVDRPGSRSLTSERGRLGGGRGLAPISPVARGANGPLPITQESYQPSRQIKRIKYFLTILT